MKQLLFILTMTADGNTSGSRTHIDTWNTLCAPPGRSDFFYVADTKLCSREKMDHIDRAGGRFVTVLPRNRLEDAEFRQWIQTNTPYWTCVWDRPNSHRSVGLRDCWYVFRAPLLSAEAWPVVWVWSPLLTLHQKAGDAGTSPRPFDELQQLRARLAGSKTRLRGAAEADLQIKVILEKHHVVRYLKVHRTVREKTRVQADIVGSPGPRHCLPQDHLAAL